MPRTGGDGDLTYTLEPDVPGLMFDDVELTLSGTPTDLGVSELTYAAMDAHGQHHRADKHVG